MQSNRDSVTPQRAAWSRAQPGGGTILELHVQPGARRDALIGEHGGRLKVAVSAPADGGRANRAVIELLARTLGLPIAAVTLRGGAGSRVKRVHVATALSPEQLAALLPPE